jgi:hypothetical protein
MQVSPCAIAIYNQSTPDSLAIRALRLMLQPRFLATFYRSVRTCQNARPDAFAPDLKHSAETGVNYISIGALTKNVQAIDLSMRIVLEKEPCKR